MSASEPTEAGSPRIWAVLDITDAEAQRWLTQWGRVVDGVPVMPLRPTDGPRRCEHCGETRHDAYTVADSIGATAECRGCYEQREQIAAIVDDRDELDATGRRRNSGGRAMSAPAQLFAVPVADDGGSTVWQEHGEVIEGTPAVPVLHDGTNRCRHCGDAGAYYIPSNRGVYACRECLAGEDWVAEVVESYDELARRSIEPAAVAPDDVVVQERAHCSLNGEKLTDLDAAERALSYLRESYNAGDLERVENLDGTPALHVTTRTSKFENRHLIRDTPNLYVAEVRSATIDGDDRLSLTIKERADDSEVSAR